jgi:hypothetical protein
LTSF